MTVGSWLPKPLRQTALERTLRPGEALFRLGDRSAGLYQVVQGKVRLVRVDASGREAVLHIAEVGDTLAESSLFSPVYHCDAIATSRSVVRLYPKAAMLAAFRTDPKAAEEFMAMLARQVMSLRTSLQLRSVRSARDRVRDYLALKAGDDGATVVLPGTVKDMAADLGLTHEALYRTLAQMASRGDIKRSNRKIRILGSYE